MKAFANLSSPRELEFWAGLSGNIHLHTYTKLHDLWTSLIQDGLIRVAGMGVSYVPCRDFEIYDTTETIKVLSCTDRMVYDGYRITLSSVIKDDTPHTICYSRTNGRPHIL